MLIQTAKLGMRSATGEPFLEVARLIDLVVVEVANETGQSGVTGTFQCSAGSRSRPDHFNR